MRRGWLRCAFLMAALAALPTTGATADTLIEQAKAQSTRTIEALERKWRADRASLSVKELNDATRDIWAGGDKTVILRLQALWISLALRDRDVSREIGGRLLTYLLTNMVEGTLSEETAWVSLALGQAYLKDERLREGAHYALINALAVGEAMERAGRGTPELTQSRARAYALLGQSLVMADRPAQAIFHLRRAMALADVAQFSDANRKGVANLLQHAEEQIRLTALDTPESNVECGPADLADPVRLKACIEKADLLWSKSDLVGVEALAARLTANVKCGSAERSEMEAFRMLHFARVLLYGPGSDAVIFTVCGLSGRLNVDDSAPYAAIVAWPLIHEHILNNVFDPRTADDAAHTARRFMRDFNNHLAWLAMDATLAYVSSWDKALDKPSNRIKQRREFLQPTIAFDMAYQAERLDWPALRDRYAKIGLAAVERANPAQIESIYNALDLYFNEDYGFMLPTPAAAMEFFARIARTLPADNPHHKSTTTIWPRLEQLYRSDEARAARVSAENLALYRKLPNADPAVVIMLLQNVADTTAETEPDNSLAARREALELVTGLQGHEGLRIDLLFEIERDRRAMGDAAGAATYFSEAVSVRRSTPSLDTRTAARVDMRLAVRMFNEGDRAGARRLAEDTFQRVIEATKGPHDGWVRYTPAKTLAEIVAADGDLPRARALYEQYVFPFTDKAVASGEEMPISTRLDLASLEALHGPTAETIKTIQILMAAGERRAVNARDLQERGWRMLAIAHLGLKDGVAALNAARRAFALKPVLTSQIRDEAADRRLSETFVSAAWRADVAMTTAK
jgi:hypothetical protein